MKLTSVRRRTLTLVLVLLPLVVAFVFVALRSGPLAPVPVTVTTIQTRALAPALFGVGTVESRYTYRLGPTVAGRVKAVNVHVGDTVVAGQVVGEMDPVDIDERVRAQGAALKRTAAGALAAEAQVRDLEARTRFAEAQARRYEQLRQNGSVSSELAEAKQQEYVLAETGLSAAQANLDSVRQELTRVRADRAALVEQRSRLQFIAPVSGVVIARNADPGTTLVAGQSVVDVIDPDSVWINVRFDQLGAAGLRAGLAATIVLRSHTQPFVGKVLRVEPMADPVTEEILAKVVLDAPPDPFPPLGAIAEVTVKLPALSAAPSVPNASIRRLEGQPGVWTIRDDTLRFAPIKVGASDLDGWVQIVDGLQAGERVVLYSMRSLEAKHRVKVVEHLPGIAP